MVEPKLSYINLPDYFTRLLRSSMQSGEDNFENLAGYISSNPSFHGLVERCFQDVDEKVRLATIIKSLGWHGFRNRMAAVFLEYQLNGQFPTKPNLELCHELTALEDSVKSQTVDGFSRAFLIAFYWKLHRYKDNNSFMESFNWRDILSHFNHTKARVVKVDWLLFSVMHLHYYLGKEVLKEALKGSPDYTELYNRLDEKQKRQYTMNALSYGASINEAEFFYQSRI